MLPERQLTKEEWYRESVYEEAFNKLMDGCCHQTAVETCLNYMTLEQMDKLVYDNIHADWPADVNIPWIKVETIDIKEEE